MSDPIFLSATKTQLIDDAYFNDNAPTADEAARAALKSRIQTIQKLMTSRYTTASAISARVVISDQVYIIYVTQS